MSPERLLQYFERISEAPDAIPRLRRFILDLAVRGKLVEQNPEDEPAEQLLMRIVSRRDSLVQAGRIKAPRTSTNECQINEWEIPRQWVFSKVQDLAGGSGVFVDGDWVESKDQDVNGDVRLTQLADVGVAVFRDKSARFLNSETAKRLNCTYLRKGDILIARMPDPLGRACIFPGSEMPCVTVVDVAILRLDEHELHTPYVMWAINSQAFLNNVALNAAGTTRSRISRGNLGKLPIPLPPLAEQHRIVAKVDALMALCDELEAAQAKREDRRARLVAATLHGLNNGDTEPGPDTALDFTQSARFYLNHLPRLTTRPEHVHQLRQTILNLAVRGKLVEQNPDDEPAEELLKRIGAVRALVPISGRSKNSKVADPSLVKLRFPMPKGWAAAKLSELVRVLNGRAYKKAELLSEGTPVLRVGNLFTSDHWYYSNLQLDDDKYCDKGDLIYAWSASFGPFIWGGPSVIYHYHIWKLDLFSQDDLDKQFLYVFLLQKTREIKNAGHGVSMVHMTKEKMEQLTVPLPPLAEQHRIVAKVDELMALCDELEAHLTTAATTRARLVDATLHEALNGARDTPEAAMAD